MNNTTPETVGLDPVVLRDQLFMLWNQKDLQTLHLAALQGFSKLSEPLEALLTILEGCPGRQKGRSHTLGHHVLFEFQTWMKELPQVTLSSLSEQQALALQSRALNLLIDTQASFVDGLINIYQLNSLDPAILVLYIMNLMSLRCYKEAAVLSVKLKLQKDLNMEEMCVPLILQNKLPLAESFVTGHYHLEQQLVTLLDSWCHAYFSVDEISRRYPRLSLTKHCMSQIQPKLLAKHVFRLMEKFNIDQGLCPNALHKRRLDSLRFLMYKTFVEKGMTEEIWSDHVQYVVADDLELRISLVELLVRYSDTQKAAQWALRYNIPRNRLPCGVWETQQDLPPDLQHIGGSAQTEDWIPSQSHCQKFYQVPLTKDKVHYVDSPEALQRCRNIVLKEGGVVGVDMEWQPTFGSGFCQHPGTVSFIRSLFSDRSIIKLGYGMSGDIKCLLATWQQLLEEPLKMEGVLDLLKIHPKIQRQKINRPQNGPKEVLVGEGSSEKGLSLLVQQVLKKPLDKTEQMSNWEKRPLRISQIRYAVADACCLLEVYSVLSGNPDQFGLPSDLRSIMSRQSEKRGDKKKKEEKSCDKEECQGAQRHLRVVCDNMLQGLGRYLRCLGVDVIMLENTDDHRVAAKLAQAEGRFILTCGQPYQTLRSQVGEGRCLSLDCAEKARDQAARVLRHFNVQLKPCDIFSRCQACNSDQYTAVPRKDMVRMLKQKGFLQDDSDHTHQQEEGKLDDFPTRGVIPEIPRYVECQWAPLSELDPDTLTFPGGAPIQLHTVPPALLPRISLFYVCTRCGKVFWEGPHYGHVLSMFHDILHITDTEAEAQQH
ncbi:hypothetical protein CgunFtcFv8_025679 [Champsocephalus gunnari]|uniref:3'-5' exonuclease domain-containing protein n=1 Tax=Champsocephalus gunnari TaxID=52237 RepID=A0AAN8CBS5_CHAGU|nr:hypothetical protein CgunFtcFv8_025679 [Champsocephalus gunnari]